MLLEAGRNGCLREVIVIAAALAIQDPQERPKDHEQHADQLHARFRDDVSDLLGWLRLWDYLHEEQRARTSSGFRKLCRDEYFNYRRVREWQDIHGQLREVARDLDLTVNRRPAEPDVVHVTLLAGLLSHVGKKDPDGYSYRGVRGSRFWISPGSTLFKRAPEWVMAAELVETSRLWARAVAAVDPAAVERVGAHLLSRSYSEPWWDVERGAAVATETVTLLGLPLVTDRTVMFGRIDAAAARELFIRHALVAGEWDTHHEFVARNREAIGDVIDVETRERRTNLLAGDEVIVAFFDERIPGDVTSVRHFDRWWREVRTQNPHLLDLSLEDLIDPAAPPPDEAAFPEAWQHGDVAVGLQYEFDPASPSDGVTIDIPAPVLDRVDPAVFEWNVPGLRPELIEALVRGLPKRFRRVLIPIADTVETLVARIDPGAGPLIPVLRHELTELTGMVVPPGVLDLDALPPHLRPRFRVVDADGEVLAEGKDLAQIKSRLVEQVRTAIGDVAHPLEATGLTRWTIGPLPRRIVLGEAPHEVVAYPSLVDEGETVGVRLLATEEEQASAMWAGTRRLVLTSLPFPERVLRSLAGERLKLVLGTSPYATPAEWIEDCLGCAIDEIVAAHGGPAWNAAAFDSLVEQVRSGLSDEALRIADVSLDLLTTLANVSVLVGRLDAAGYERSLADVVDHVRRLVYPGFLTEVTADRVPDLARYLDAIEHRLRRLPERREHDEALMNRIGRLEEDYEQMLGVVAPSPDVEDIAWMLEELRVSLFAQHLGTREKVSEKRIARAMSAALG